MLCYIILCYIVLYYILYYIYIIYIYILYYIYIYYIYISKNNKMITKWWRKCCQAAGRTGKSKLFQMWKTDLFHRLPLLLLDSEEHLPQLKVCWSERDCLLLQHNEAAVVHANVLTDVISRVPGETNNSSCNRYCMVLQPNCHVAQFEVFSYIEEVFLRSMTLSLVITSSRAHKWGRWSNWSKLAN